MAGDIVSVKTTQIENQRLSYCAISFDEWDTALEPEIQAGSKIEISGSLYTFTGAEDIDSGAAWAGIANSTIVYCYIETTGGGLTCVGVLDTVAPTWDEAKQGWYNGADRCYGLIYKDAAGDYTQKTMLIDRERGFTYQGICLMNSANADKVLRFASDASIGWDESEDEFVIDKDLSLANDLIVANDISLEYATVTTAGTLLLTVAAGATTNFEIKIPCLLWIDNNSATGTTRLYARQNNTTGEIATAPAGTDIYGIVLNPGSYQLDCSTTGGSALIYCTGVFGKTTITANEIIV